MPTRSPIWALASPALPLFAADLPARNATMWFYEEWSLDNPSHEGNPFDLADIDPDFGQNDLRLGDNFVCEILIDQLKSGSH